MCAYDVRDGIQPLFWYPVGFSQLAVRTRPVRHHRVFTYWSSRRKTLRKRDEPQPHEEPYAYATPHEPGLEMLRERYTRGEIEP